MANMHANSEASSPQRSRADSVKENTAAPATTPLLSYLVRHTHPLSQAYRRQISSGAISAVVLALTLCVFLNYVFVVISSNTAAHPINLYPWDANWYRGIVEQGYSFNGNYNQQQNIAFSPAYPILCRAVKHLLKTDTALAMHVVSTMCFFVTLVFLYLLVAKLFSPAFALGTTVVYATNPFTLFQLYGYGDVVFVTSTALFFYFLEIRRNLLLSALCVSAAAISRPYGILLVFPLVAALAQINWDPLSRKRTWWRTVQSWVRYTPIAGLGLLLYALWSQYRFGSPLAFLHIHQAWNAPCGTLTWYTRLAMTNLIADMHPVFAQDLLNPPGLAALFVVGVSVGAVLTASYRWLPLSMNVYWLTLTGFLLASSTGCHPNLIALGRHSLGIIPLFLILMIMVARLCDYPLGKDDRRDSSGFPAFRLLFAAAIVTVVNIVLLCNYIHRFFGGQWVA